jgi:DNA replicative helicase MCM subunit Mcm2 (Cdc46/Mcm family)
MSSWQLMSLDLIVGHNLSQAQYLRTHLPAGTQNLGPENTKGTIKSSQMGYANKPLADGSSLHSYANSNETIPQDFLRKYLSHARDTCQPRLHSIDQDKISRLYADLRRESAICGGVPIAVRHLESLMRMAEAHVATPCYVLF